MPQRAQEKVVRVLSSLLGKNLDPYARMRRDRILKRVQIWTALIVTAVGIAAGAFLYERASDDSAEWRKVIADSNANGVTESTDQPHEFYPSEQDIKAAQQSGAATPDASSSPTR